MTSSRRLKALVGVAAIGLLAAACGGSSSKSSSTGGTAKGGAEAYNAAITSEVNPSTAKGGTLKLIATEDFDSLDPQRTYYGYVWDFRRLWDRQMFQFTPSPGKASLGLSPDLSTDMGTVTDGGKTVTYHIRPGVKFANGEPVTSMTEKYAIERLFAEDVINGGPTYLVDLLGGAASYPGPYKDKSADHLGLKTVDTPDASTIVFHLTKPFSDMDYLLALPSSTPVPIDVDQAPATGGANYAKHPISAGPYKVDSYIPGKSMTLSRNTYWSQKTDPVHKALPDNIDVTIGTDPDTADKEVIQGTADYVIDSPVQTAQRAQILRNPTGVGKYADNPLEAYTTQWFDLPASVIPNIHCRNAIGYAINKKSLQDVFGGPTVGGQIANTVIPPASPSYDASVDPYEALSQPTGDLTKAKSELKACGMPSGFSTKFAARQTGFGPKVAIAVQAALARVGIKTTFVPTTRSADPTKSPSQVKKLGLGIISFNWGADFPTDYGFYEFVADPRSIEQAGNYNEGEFSNPMGSTLIDKALTETGAAQAATWKQFGALLDASGTAVPYLYPKEIEVHSPRLTNVHTLYAIFNNYDLMNVGVGG